MGRPFGSKNRRRPEDSLRVYVHLLPEEYAHIQEVITREGMTFQDFGRKALHDAALGKIIQTYFYVRLPDGTFHPAQTEQGYEFVENAKRFAHQVNGKVVSAPQLKDGPPGGPPAHRPGVDPGELRSR